MTAAIYLEPHERHPDLDPVGVAIAELAIAADRATRTILTLRGQKAELLAATRGLLNFPLGTFGNGLAIATAEAAVKRATEG